MDKFYCKNCKHLFNDIQNTRFRQKIVSYRSGEFMKWLRSILFSEQYEIKYIKNIYIVNCPFCMSKDTINATEILEMIEYQRNNKLGNYKLNQYNKNKLILYNEILKAFDLKKIPPS